MPQTRIHALSQVLQAIVERPEPGALVIACGDHEVVYLAALLARLDEHSPADRFCVLADPFANADQYRDMFAATAAASAAEAGPEFAMRAIVGDLLADLPPGDHRLVVALVPSKIDHPSAWSTLIDPLLAAPIDARLRLIVRDDRLAAQPLFTAAARSMRPGIHAYAFALPPALLLASVVAVAHDRGRPPDERALALLQLASLDLGHGRHAHALARCRASALLAVTAPLRAFARALEADVLRHSGDHDAALAVGLAALGEAVDSATLPVVQHVALALGELLRDLRRSIEAAACFELAERAASHNPEVQARARAQRSALEDPRC